MFPCWDQIALLCETFHGKGRLFVGPFLVSGVYGRDKNRARRGGGERKGPQAPLSFFLAPYPTPLARLANFSFRPILHLGACSQARRVLSYLAGGQDNRRGSKIDDGKSLSQFYLIFGTVWPSLVPGDIDKYKNHSCFIAFRLLLAFLLS